MMVSCLVVLTIGLPWLGALFVWLIRDHHPRIQHGLASVFALAAGLASLLLFPSATDEVVLIIPVGGIFGDFTFIPDGLGVLLAAIATIIGSLAVIFSIDYMHGESQLGRYYALILIFIGAMAGLVLSGSLLVMFIFWEITAFCSYALISFHNDDPKAVAGGIKALIVTQLGGIGLLTGALIVFAYLDSYQINTFLAEAHTLPEAVSGFIAFGFLAAAVAKSAQVPMHTWLPDAMEAPTPVTALIHAATMVNAGVYLLARFYPAFAPVPGWKVAVTTIGLLSALLAAVMAVAAYDLKRALAFSTISQLGYMFYAVGIGAIFASQFHLFSHALFKGLLFLSAGAVIHAVGTRDMRQMGGLGRRMPLVGGVFIIGSFALAGLPITNGFFSKELILEGGSLLGPRWAFAGTLIGVGLTALYATRMVTMVFFSESDNTLSLLKTGQAMRFSLSILALGTLTTWLLMGPMSQLLADTLPYHRLGGYKTWTIVHEIVSDPLTWLVLAVICLGGLMWLLGLWSVGLARISRPLINFARNDFGFEWVNERLSRAVREVSAVLSITQTGLLNWNVAGIVGGLALLLAILIGGMR